MKTIQINQEQASYFIPVDRSAKFKKYMTQQMTDYFTTRKGDDEDTSDQYKELDDC